MHNGRNAPLHVLVIDEAAQLRECESMIPLHLRGIRHAILIGDERQLPSVVMSEVAKDAGFGRSMFERLSSLGAHKHLLNIQYRMHPSISLFPNYMFYSGQIHDAPTVMSRSYQKSYLPSPFFGPFSLINITDGREERSRNAKKSFRNSIEAAIVLGILNKLFQAWWSKTPKEDLSIGVISPYSGQVGVIREKLGCRYEYFKGFKVKVMTVDGFQGGEEDIIILSTVRSNGRGSIGFLSRPQLTNVALTRERYCLWILGSKETLERSRSEWAALVDDAKDRGCLFNADEDKDLAKAIFEAKKEGNCLEDLLYGQSLLFKNALWKVIFCNSFLDSFRNLPLQAKPSVVDLLQKLSSGWIPMNINLDTVCANSFQIMKKLEVGGFYVIWTVDIENDPKPFQVLKFWFIVPDRALIRETSRYLDVIYQECSDNFIKCCKEKCLEGLLEVPKVWDSLSDLHDNADVSRNHINDTEVSTRILFFRRTFSIFIVPGRAFIREKIEHLDVIYQKCSDNFINRCKEKCLAGLLEVPKAWDSPSDLHDNADGRLYRNDRTLEAWVDDFKHIPAALDDRDWKRKRKACNEGDYRDCNQDTVY